MGAKNTTLHTPSTLWLMAHRGFFIFFFFDKLKTPREPEVSRRYCAIYFTKRTRDLPRMKCEKREGDHILLVITVTFECKPKLRMILLKRNA